MREVKYITLKSGAMRRQIYFFECSVCHQNRESVYKNKADQGICRGCRRAEINKNQANLFDPPEGHEANPGGVGMPSDLKKEFKSFNEEREVVKNLVMDQEKLDAKPTGILEPPSHMPVPIQVSARFRPDPREVNEDGEWVGKKHQNKHAKK